MSADALLHLLHRSLGVRIVVRLLAFGLPLCFFGGMALCVALYIENGGGGDGKLHQISVYGSASGLPGVNEAEAPNLAIFIATAVLVLLLTVPLLVFRASVTLGAARVPGAKCTRVLARLACASGCAGVALLVATACIPCCEGAVPAWAPPRQPQTHNEVAKACFSLITAAALADTTACLVLNVRAIAPVGFGTASCIYQAACVIGAMVAFCGYVGEWSTDLTVVNSLEWLGVALVLIYYVPFALTLARCLNSIEAHRRGLSSATELEAPTRGCAARGASSNQPRRLRSLPLRLASRVW